ncbi:MAG: patatin-like phospholipase family protein [Bacteroidota bacterium]
MLKRLLNWVITFYYLFPIQLLINHFKRNHVLLICWLVLFAIVTGNFGNYLGIPFLFLDPVYLNQVSFESYFLVGLTLAGFTIAFHITTYISDGHRFTFVGTLKRPFTTFSINNSILPLAFLITYITLVIKYELSNEDAVSGQIMLYVAGLFTGYLCMTLLLFSYFWFTNKNIFKYVVCKVDEKLKQNIKITRAGAIKKLDIAKKKQVRVDHFFSTGLRVKKTSDHQGFYDKETILQVFDQNHLNLVIIELLIFMLLLLIGTFKDVEALQIPAAASVILFLTVFVMFAGAFSYWFGNWSISAAIGLLLFVNLLVSSKSFENQYQAFGLDYGVEPSKYNIDRISQLGGYNHITEDKSNTLKILEKWRSKFPDDNNPKMVLVCVSGGGQRAALWTLNVLQHADEMNKGGLMENTMLITGASGGLIGASYFRELIYQEKSGNSVSPYGAKHLSAIASDNLNAIIFSLLMNDIFVGFQKFEYEGFEYKKDRGYAFEDRLNRNTKNLLNKPLASYKYPEKESIIPMLIMAPTIINDGRKLYISPQNVSYLSNVSDSAIYKNKLNGVDFLRLFKGQSSEKLRFLSGLRMSATFPYITPNVTLPSDPPTELMDAGITDNFGVSDAIRFLFAFKDWISENTSGVIIMSIRDSEKDGPIQATQNLSLFERFTLPISSIYENFEGLQDVTNDNKIEYARSWFKGSIDRVDFQYIPEEYARQNLSRSDELRMKNAQRASLSWRLTGREKRSVVNNINTHANQNALLKLRELLSNK